jgi:RsiW-degrading membrane proteinase PrsW (M82 family)
LKPGFIAAAAIGLIVMGAAAWWVFRWIGAKVDGEWPKLEPSSAVRRRAREWSVLWAFVWGILSTVVAIAVEVLLLLMLGSRVAQLRLPVSVTPLDVAGLADDPGFIIGVFLALSVVAPLIEEVVKALGLWFARGAIRSHGDGLLLGLAAGLGFGLVESAGNVVNGVGSLFLFVVIWARVAAMLMHSVTTGLVGAGYARARLTGDRRALWSGLIRAVVLHGAWNAIGAVTILAGLRGDALLPLALLIVLIVLAVRIVPRVVTASIDRSIQDDHAASDVDLPREWSPMDDGVWWRLAGGRPVYPRRDAPVDIA